MSRGNSIGWFPCEPAQKKLEMSEVTIGVVLALAAGVLNGSFAAPTKYVSLWKWENIWAVWAIVALLLPPWVLWRVPGAARRRSYPKGSEKAALVYTRGEPKGQRGNSGPYCPRAGVRNCRRLRRPEPTPEASWENILFARFSWLFSGLQS
jgi:hypothetical protein